MMQITYCNRMRDARVGNSMAPAKMSVAAVEQFLRDDDTRGERRGTGAETFADGDIVRNLQADQRQSPVGAGGYGERGLPDQIIGKRGDQCRIATGDADGKPAADSKPTFEIYLQGYTESVETGAEICARSGNAESCN